MRVRPLSTKSFVFAYFGLALSVVLLINNFSVLSIFSRFLNVILTSVNNGNRRNLEEFRIKTSRSSKVATTEIPNVLEHSLRNISQETVNGFCTTFFWLNCLSNVKNYIKENFVVQISSLGQFLRCRKTLLCTKNCSVSEDSVSKINRSYYTEQ